MWPLCRFAAPSFPPLWTVNSGPFLIISSSVRKTYTPTKRTCTSGVPSSEKWRNSVGTRAPPGTSGGTKHHVVSALGWCATNVFFSDSWLLLRVMSETPTCPGDLVYVEQGPAFPPSCSNPSPAPTNGDLVNSCVCPTSEDHLFAFSQHTF